MTMTKGIEQMPRVPPPPPPVKPAKPKPKTAVRVIGIGIDIYLEIEEEHEIEAVVVALRTCIQRAEKAKAGKSADNVIDGPTPPGDE